MNGISVRRQAPFQADASSSGRAQPGSRAQLRVRASGIVSKNLKVKQVPTVTKLEWTSPLKIVKYPDPKLRAVNAKIATFDESLLKLAREMIAVMYEDDGVGLAAPQVGVNVRLMVFNEHGRYEQGNEAILVNPEIVMASKATEVDQEGCLSFPKIYADVERSTEIVVRAQNERGEPVELKLQGFLARIFQHEFDHLQGVLYHDRMKPKVLDEVRQPLVALEEEYLAAHPGAKVQRLPATKAAKGFGK